MARSILSVLAAAALFVPFSCRGAGSPLAGRWDVTIHLPGSEAPSWFEVVDSGGQLSGRFVGRFGSARPIRTVTFSDDRLVFDLPPQYENRKTEMRFEGTLQGDRLSGITTGDRGEELKWEAHRAPALNRKGRLRWADPVALFNGRDLGGWAPRAARRLNGWTVRDGALYNAQPGNDLVTTNEFTDFKLHTDFRYPKESNSGIYLRGRYEVQIEDDYGHPLNVETIGGIYGFFTPKVNACRPPDEWQAFDITLVGRRVTVVLNAKMLLDRQEIPGITGGALDSDEGTPGPIFFQGDHGHVEFRNIVLTPARR